MKNEEEKKEESKEEKKVEEKKEEKSGMCKFFKPKPFTDLSSKIASLTQWVEVTIGELKRKVDEEVKEKLRKKEDEETCPICMCELYDDLDKKSEQEI